MKIRVTEIEASAEELKASQDLSSAFTNAFRAAFVERPSNSKTHWLCFFKEGDSRE